MPTFSNNTPLPWLVVWNQTPGEFDSMVPALRHPSIDYRPISICMHGEQAAPHLPDDRLYSSIWVKRPGPKWQIQSYLTKPQLESYLDAQRNKGSFPRLIAAYANNVGGDGFAVVVEEGFPESWVEPMVWGVELATRLPKRRREGFFPRWCAAYGTNFTVSGSLIRYAFVWEKQPNVEKNWWNGFPANDPSNPPWEASFGDQFMALTKGFWRPDLVCPVEGSHGFVNNQLHLFGPRYFSVWRDEQLNNWSLHTIGISALTGLLQGIAPYRFPIRLQVAGKKGDAKQFAMLLVAASDELMPRTFQVQYASSPQTATAPTPFKACDEWVRARMRTWNMRCGQLAIAYKGKLVHASAHTRAEAGYPPLTPTTVMAPGSISKVFTAMLVARLWDQGLLDPFTQNLNVLLGLTPADPNFSSRKVVQLLSHSSGLLPDNVIAPSWNPMDAATAFQSLQPTDWHWMQYLLKQPPPAPPLPPGGFFAQPAPPNNAQYNPPPSTPAPATYSGAGIMLAAQCAVRQTPVTTAEAGLREFLFKPLGIKRARVIDLMASQAAEDPTTARLHDNPGYAPNNFNLQLDPNGKVIAVGIEPYTYAGRATMGAAAGGWFMAAADVARLFSLFDLPTNPLFSSQNQWIGPTMLYRYGNGWGMGFAVSGYSTNMPTAAPLYSWHNGAGLGATALAVRRNDGVVVVVMFNHGDLNDALDTVMFIAPDGTDLLGHVDSHVATEGWPTWDLFHTMDLPEY